MDPVIERLERLERELIELAKTVKEIDSVMALHLAECKDARNELREQIEEALDEKGGR